MSLQLFTSLPLGPGTQIDLVDLYIGDGVTTSFNLVYKTGSRLGGTIQFDVLQYYLFNGGFIKNGNTFTLVKAPPAGSQGVAPGVSCLTFNAYDQAVVPGQTNPNVSQIPFILGDVTEIQNFSYTAYPTYPGIQLAFVDLITALGQESVWCQLACSGNFGAVGVFNGAGNPLYTSPLSAAGTIATGTNPGVNIAVGITGASGFQVNDYILINPGTVTAEVCRIQTVGSNYLILDGMNFAHNVGEPVYTCGRLFYAKITIPIGQFGGQAQTLYELGLQVLAQKVSRL